ncbi:MAG: (Na+)-NQR maturation NqrM [Nitrospira sp.]|nr:(Na+)-NQR maturation NqrM [Nitrospira sp.]
MTIFLVTFLVMGIAILAMAVGVLVGRNPIGGSCGGLERIGLECDAGCDKPCPERLALSRTQGPRRTLQAQPTRPDRDGKAREGSGS